MQVQKPPFSSSIVTVKAGSTIPETFLQKLVSENRSAIGFAVKETDKIVVEKFLELGEVDKEFTAIKEILENTKKFPRMFVFSQFPEEYDEDEAMPWIIVKDSKGNPVIVVAMEGDFPGREIDGNSECYGLINEYVGPKIEALYKLLGNNPAKLFEAMRAPEFGNDLLNTVAHRGVFAFMPSTGDLFAHGKNDQGGDFSWGTASFTYGYTESAIEAATPAAADQPVGAKRSKYASEAEPQPLPDGVHRVAPVVPKVEPAPVIDPVAKAADDTTEGHFLEPPKNLHGKKLKKWYRDIDPAGVLPADWAKRPKVFVKHKTVVKDLKDLSQTALGTTVKIPDKELPVISGPQQAVVNEFIKKYLDGASNQIENPLEIQKQEAMLPVFSELCPKATLEHVDHWKQSAINALCKSHPEAAWLLILELRADRLKRNQLLKLGDKTLGELAGTDVHTVKPVTTAPTPVIETPVHKKSRYG